MAPYELHYSRGKLIRLGLLAIAVTALMLWIALGGLGEDVGGGRRGGLARMLGPEGMQALGWLAAAGTGAMALLAFRRAFADRVAARGDAQGVIIHTLFGTHAYAVGDIDRIELRRPAGQPLLMVVPVPGRGKERGLALNGLAEDEEEIAAWIETVETAWHGGGGEL